MTRLSRISAGGVVVAAFLGPAWAKASPSETMGNKAPEKARSKTAVETTQANPSANSQIQLVLSLQPMVNFAHPKDEGHHTLSIGARTFQTFGAGIYLGRRTLSDKLASQTSPEEIGAATEGGVQLSFLFSFIEARIKAGRFATDPDSATAAFQTGLTASAAIAVRVYPLPPGPLVVAPGKAEVSVQSVIGAGTWNFSTKHDTTGANRSDLDPQIAAFFGFCLSVEYGLSLE